MNKSGIFIYKGMGMSLFGGNESVGKVYADNINAYHKAFGGSVRVFDMVVPTSAEFYLPEKYKKLSNSEEKAVSYTHLFEIGKEPFFIALLGKGKTRCLLHYTGRRFW